ncbi:hypothetical protein GW17_00050061 [Ensete ventricosum]|nr:hypothetical protein GW17_00050061 [Ensete ventricosum]RZR91028.1 hypothetical protein BHM03_00019073 [Ensete ventricosum]
MKSGGGASNGSTVPSMANVSATIDVDGSVAEKRPNTSEGASMRNTAGRQLPSSLWMPQRASLQSPLKRGKGRWRSRRPRAGYTIRDLCEVEDHAGADRYFASIMMRLKTVEGEDPLVPRWSTIFGLTQVWTNGLLAAEYLRGALHPVLAKQVY